MNIGYLYYIWLKIRYNSPVKVILDGLSKAGILIEPYYVFLEGLSHENQPHWETQFSEYEICFLGQSDIKVISEIPFRDISQEKLLLRLEEGKKCLGVKYLGELAAFTWCDLYECNFKGYRFILKDNEAYLFDAHTLTLFRGKGIAPYMRFRFYKELAKLGKNNLYSISHCFDIPSIKFKKKLNARPLELRITIGLFKKWQFNSRLKRISYLRL